MVDLTGGILWGTNGDNAIDGWNTKDTYSGVSNVTGSQHDDTLVGDAGANILEGGAGVDLLFGNGGADELYGVQGADIFLIEDGTETGLAIQDFQSGLDKIALGSIGFGDIVTDGFDSAEFSLEVASSYDGIAGTDTGIGLVYVSNGTTGELWYGSDRQSSGNETKIADIVEFDLAGSETDNDLEYADFMTYSIPEA